MKSHIIIQTKFIKINHIIQCHFIYFYECFNQCQHKQNKLKENKSNKSNSGRFHNLAKEILF